MQLHRLRLGRKRTCIGIDVGATGVRAVQLEWIDGTWCATHVARTERGPTDGDPTEIDLSEVAPRLRRLVSGESFAGRSAVTAVQSPLIEFHSLELPEQVFHAGHEETRDVVRWELSRLLNKEPELIESSHWMLPPTPAPGPNAMGAAAHCEPIVAFCSLCKEAGLRCERVDAMPMAVQRFGMYLRHWIHRQVWGVLDLGARGSRLVLSVGDVPVLTRDIGTGGAAWTAAIAEALQVSHKAAEIHKREHGIASTPRGARADDAGLPSSKLSGLVFGALRQQLGALAAEIKRSYEYILSRYSTCEAADLVLVGGGAAMPHLAGYLGRSLGITVAPASEFLDDATGALRFSSARGLRLEQLAPAIGIALDDREVRDEA